jgi:hypothetical protein
VIKAAPKFGFGTGGRDDSNNRKGDITGPGSYDIPNSIGREGVK